MGKLLFLFCSAFVLNSSKAASQASFRRVPDSNATKINLRVLPQNFYNQQLGYFCKKEVQFQTAVRLPVYFRLGSKEYVDWMERKPNAVKR